jgi:serine/threonine protein kinase
VPQNFHSLFNKIALEYCGGGSAEDICNGINSLYRGLTALVWQLEWTEESIAVLLKQAVAGLDYMHQRNMIHRDIKGT